mmetsp:Transcript_20362/g.52860  ORF Transcript_20362/g.52860 Transcript_20362/m.52860 type:complete len:430 (-) Transcript_20362:137-1426(-)|eukprot:CAMPEP_0182925108 /NCGR_PEP_ID=MMETSP0105_2-20130417/8132_1 /TAXON_ID=81532 ORGANISM="Acanthoeca-like sp., Strain 10tr" /NCGR_SAMPLE_ID=MMETSP0105_2 /ASSEMBLY_ACC=CAM_ASM_000205 /LENGTH=429 /DNA_ID=CAMNT_0025062941 /DNA_START=23 /DNA_END=1312 /DNA_ORIENTATION=-
MGAGVQSLGTDGVHVCGRMAGLAGIVCLAWYAIALMTTNWSYTENYGNLGGVQVGYVEWGLSEYCLKTTIENFEGSEHLICFKYLDDVPLTDADGTETSNQNGFDHFSGLQERIAVVYFGTITALLACFSGAVFSEKPIINIFALATSAIAGCIAMSAWLNFQEELKSDSAVEVGTAGGLVIGAWMLSALGSLMACLDRQMTSMENQHSFMADGISVFGRVASVGTIVTWLLFGLAVNSPQWSTTSDLGTVGGLCDRSISTAECGDASFGLWRYSIQGNAQIVNNGTQFVDVSLAWDESVTTAGVTADGNERFDSYGTKVKREVASAGVLIGILVAILADWFNEKLMFASTMMWIAAVSGMIAMSAWVNFQEELSKDTASKVEFSDGGWLLVFAWLTAMLSGIALCCNGRRLKSLNNPTTTVNEGASSV